MVQQQWGGSWTPALTDAPQANWRRRWYQAQDPEVLLADPNAQPWQPPTAMAPTAPQQGQQGGWGSGWGTTQAATTQPATSMAWQPQYSAKGETDLSKAPPKQPPTPNTAPQPGAASTQSLTPGVVPKIADSNLPWQGGGGDGGAGDWWNRIPEWTEGGGYPVGRTWNEATKSWTANPTPVAAGTEIGADVGWRTGLKLPATYNALQDNSAFEYKGKDQELGIARAIRQTADFMRTNPGGNAQNYFNFLLANFTRDAAKRGQSTGFDPAAFAQVGYGEAYNPGKQYASAAVPTGAGQGGGLDPNKVPTVAGTNMPGFTPTATPPTPTTNSTSNTGNTNSTGNISDPSAQLAANDPKLMALLLRQQRGQTGPNRGGRIAQYGDDYYGKALAVLANLSPKLTGGSVTDILRQAAGNIGSGQGLSDMMHGAASDFAGRFDPLSVSADNATQLLNYLSAATGYGSGTMGRAQLDYEGNNLSDALNLYELNGGSDYYKDHPLNQSDYWRRLRQIGGY